MSDYSYAIMTAAVSVAVLLPVPRVSAEIERAMGAEPVEIAVTCDALGRVPPDEALDDLVKFRGELFGKDALRWSATDFAILSGTILECGASHAGRNEVW